MTGSLWCVGVGPGNPELITRKAARLIETADVVAYHRAGHRPSTARAIAADLIPDGVVEEELVYPVTTGEIDHPGGYHGAMAAFYLECAERLGAHLEAGRSVVLLAEGDPLFFGSSMYVHDLLAERFDAHVVPGVTSVSAASAGLSTGLCRHEDVLTVLPGTLPVTEMARRLADTDAAVIMKLGRTFANVREALAQAGLLERAWYVERASRDGERLLPVTQVDPAHVPYMSLVVVPGLDRRADAAGRASGSASSSSRTAMQRVPGVLPAAATSERSGEPGTVFVVGLGPGPDAWLTPEAADVLGRVSYVIGYAPYVARVPTRDGLVRLPSGNTVEVDRGTQALELAHDGHDVAVVSGGDAGVFGMASAVFEARERPENAALAGMPVHVVPGVTAAHAAAALAGAVLGGDHALISLSDRLKPWDVIDARLRSCARADLAMAFYNPRSASRPHQFDQALSVLREELPGDRPVVVARHVGREQEALEVTSVAALDPETIDMGCLVIVGSQGTRTTADGRVWTARFVPSR